ncbi:MAG: DUF4252 domain-containing protein [Prolixibacteraceae bacterium]|jgi:hypothetical protein|nr:DUF4252 domain-containing protein [Prolixibacteraceae bacterium]
MKKMKIKFLTLLFVCLPMLTWAKGGVPVLYAQTSGLEDVQRFTISASWLGNTSLDCEINVESLMKNTDDIYFLTTSTQKKKLFPLWDKIRKDFSYKKMMSIHDDGSNIECWCNMKSRNTIEEVVMVIQGDNSLLLLGLTGEYSKQQIKELMKKNKKITVKTK